MFVTAAGMRAIDAADLVEDLVGQFWIPNALCCTDTLARIGRPGFVKLAATPPTNARSAARECGRSCQES
jgi:hypothetical protein